MQRLMQIFFPRDQGYPEMSGRQVLSQEQRNVGPEFEYAIERTCVLSIMCCSRFSMLQNKADTAYNTQCENESDWKIKGEGQVAI